MAHETQAEGRRETDYEDAVLASYTELRGSFMRGIHGDLHADIPAPGFAPASMPTWQVIHQMLYAADADGGQLVELLRVVVRASESMDPLLAGMAQRVIATLAREHAQLHKEDHAAQS